MIQLLENSELLQAFTSVCDDCLKTHKEQVFSSVEAVILILNHFGCHTKCPVPTDFCSSCVTDFLLERYFAT